MTIRALLPRWRDVLLAVPVGVLVLVVPHVGPRRGPWPSGPTPSADPAALVLSGIAVAAIALRRWPVVAFALAVTATSAALGLDAAGPVLLTVALTAYSVGRGLPLPRSAAIAGAGVLVLLLPSLLAADAADAALRSLPLSAWVVVPFCAVLVRRAVLGARDRRRVEEERQVLDAERLRLASEVHDIVGHGLAAIQMQADVALHVADRRPEQAREALGVISRASAEALAELRATLAEVAPASARDDHAPVPGLDRLEDLCARMRDAGIEVDLAVTGESEPIPSAVQVVAYRIVQESLTNVVKHAARRRADVAVDVSDGTVTILVTSAIHPGVVGSEGFGIRGMRRRAADIGGRADVRFEDGRCTVRAVLPYAR